jgi:hypothetical protein
MACPCWGAQAQRLYEPVLTICPRKAPRALTVCRKPVAKDLEVWGRGRFGRSQCD